MITIQHIANYYLSKLSWNDLAGLLRHSYSEHIQAIALIKSTRKRFISEFEIHIENNKPRIERIPTKPFGQTLAEIENNIDFDFRKLSRVFTELPGKYLTESLYSLIRKVIKKILNNNESPKKINLSLHHTRIVCTSNANASNYPEGIHQDGMDYIVSAFVVERHNIDGGEIIIYSSDKKTPPEFLKQFFNQVWGFFNQI
ncbi:hypothetical protein ACH42_03470 [Endozoicomonas sp. (ex Bugula neritina AB1)]|nr:hypothetical protein ACH42_03470 [Endozoicomonas sp. (ex Bugula neritina AB1)]